VPYRTHLTTPPGETPVIESGQSRELYTSALAIPAEPKVPMRFRGHVIAVAVIVALGLAVWLGFRTVTSGQDFDPSLDIQTPDEEFDPTIPVDPNQG
jgi:hypothetical protein